MINPKDLIRTLSIEELCRTAEAYYKSIPDPTPQLAKPFSSLLEGPDQLQSMGLLLSGLRLGKTMSVLEFGAGTCWFSRFLTQAQCQTIACDPSETALALGRRLFELLPILGDVIAEPRFLHFDGHTIDLPDASVDRIISYDAFHHVPNQAQVLGEFARVLKDGGIVGFSEPGLFHSRSPQSQYEMQNFTVLENDIVIREIFPLAQAAGFTSISFKLLSNLDLSLAQYLAIVDQRDQPIAERTRLQSVLASVTGKTQIERMIMQNVVETMTNKTIFFLYKGEPVEDSRTHGGLAHAISVEGKQLSARPGEALALPVRITNTGHARWLHENVKEIGVVKVGTHLYSSAGQLLNLDHVRQTVPRTILPGETFSCTFELVFDEPGDYRLAVDLVAEGICWFENVGAKPQYVDVHVS